MTVSSASQQVFSTEIPELFPEHLKALREGSGLSIEIIKERGYRSILGKKQLLDLGFSKRQCPAPGLLLPVHGPDGTPGPACYRPDSPRVVRDKMLKYELPAGAVVRLDVPPRCRNQLEDPSIDLWIPEGIKKGDAVAQQGLCVVTLLGVWNFKGKNDFGGIKLLADFDLIPFNNRTVNIVFDSDIVTKPQVRAAMARLKEHLKRRGALVNVVYLPGGEDGAKVGVDDFLLNHTVDDLKALVQQPPPTPKAADPRIELLDDAPSTLRQPLQLIDGVSYAVTWPWMKTTITESLNKEGEIIRQDPPIVTTSRGMAIVRGDGAVFGPGPLDDFPLEISLSDMPQDGKLWRTQGVKAYRSGQRSDYVDVFRRIVLAYDHFIDFARSFASQPVMCELSACLSLMTWLREAFTVLPYPYPNGDRGSGKTHWGNVWASTSYLGFVILSSGSFAALRDLADYGASLLFDDAEHLCDPKRSDPDKRALFLAGNRRGVMVPIKEPAPNGKGWVTRWVNAFCPRGFTAISLPDPVLASRSITLPLVRTTDHRRGNADPADIGRWPCNQRQLQDDLWATGLALLPEAAEIWAELDGEEELTGREFEPWRAIIAVARLFERHGVTDLEERMRSAMRAYQDEKADLNTGDRTVQVIKALLACHLTDPRLDVSDIADVSDVYTEGCKELKVNSSQLAEVITELGKEEGFDTEWVSARTVGWKLKSLRLVRERDPKTKKRTRYWTLSSEALLELAQAYGIIRRGSTETQKSKTTISLPASENVRYGQNVRNGQPEQPQMELEPPKPTMAEPLVDKEDPPQPSKEEVKF